MVDATGRSPVRFLVTTVALAGTLLAAYLTWAHFDADALVCGLGDCHAVQASEFAAVGPFPVALLGLGMYAAVLLCNLVAAARPEHAMVTTTIAFAAALGGTVYAAYLTWLGVAVIGAICQWCVVSAVLTAMLAILEGAAIWGALAAPPASDGETGAAGAAFQQLERQAGPQGTGPLGLGGSGTRAVR